MALESTHVSEARRAIRTRDGRAGVRAFGRIAPDRGSRRSRLHASDRDRTRRTLAGSHHRHHALQRAVSWAALRVREGRPVVIDVYNDTDTPEQLHWHGQPCQSTSMGPAEEGTPFIPPHGHRRISFTPGPAGVRFYHTHTLRRARSARGPIQRPGRHRLRRAEAEPGAYDQEVFLAPEGVRARRSAAAVTCRWIFCRRASRDRKLETPANARCAPRWRKGCRTATKSATSVRDQRADARTRRARSA